MNAAIEIGSELKSDNLDSLADAIIRVATASPFKEVNIEALEAFRHVLRLPPVSVTNCTFTYGQSPTDGSVPVMGSGWDASSGNRE